MRRMRLGALILLSSDTRPGIIGAAILLLAVANVALLGGCATDSEHRCCVNSETSTARIPATGTQAQSTKANASESYRGSSEAINSGSPSGNLVRLASFEPAADATPAQDQSTLQPARPEELPPTASVPAEELTFDQAVELCLLNDPRLRAGFQ